MILIILAIIFLALSLCRSSCPKSPSQIDLSCPHLHQYESSISPIILRLDKNNLKMCRNREGRKEVKWLHWQVTMAGQASAAQMANFRSVLFSADSRVGREYIQTVRNGKEKLCSQEVRQCKHVPVGGKDRSWAAYHVHYHVQALTKNYVAVLYCAGGDTCTIYLVSEQSINNSQIQELSALNKGVHLFYPYAA